MNDLLLQTSLIDKTPTDTAGRRFVDLTQAEETGMDKTASIFDLSQMISIAKGGQSARSYKKNECPADIEDDKVNVRLNFESWPSSPTLAYTLVANIGDITPAVIVEEYTEFSLVFRETDVAELDFILSDIDSYLWETPTVTPTGQPVVNPTIAMDGFTTIRTEQPIFGVVRIKGKKQGARHVLTHSLIKSYPVRPDAPLPDEGVTDADLEEYWAYTDVATINGEPADEQDTVDMTGLSIENLSITVTAKWLNEDGDEETESIRLEIPQCIKDLLEPCAPDDQDGDSVLNICPGHENNNPLRVYYSSCTGKALAVIAQAEDDNSWCK